MELVEKFDNKRLPLNKTLERYEKILGEYKQSVHIWFMNDNGEFLIQKRAPDKKVFPNKWAHTGGGVAAYETPLQTVVRECKEELGIDVDLNQTELMLSFKRKFDFIDVYLVKQNFEIEDLVFSDNEVTDAKWVSVDEMKELINNNEFAPTIDIYYEMLLNLIEYPW